MSGSRIRKVSRVRGPEAVDRLNPAWTADTEALANYLWRLIRVYRRGPALRRPASTFPARPSSPIAPEPDAE